jgi:hypothetical protein
MSETDIDVASYVVCASIPVQRRVVKIEVFSTRFRLKLKSTAEIVIYIYTN